MGARFVAMSSCVLARRSSPGLRWLQPIDIFVGGQAVAFLALTLIPESSVEMYSLLALSKPGWWIALVRVRMQEHARTMVSRHESKKYLLPAEEHLRRHPFLGQQQAFSITDPWWIM